VQALIAQQDSIGWDQLLFGRFSCQWRTMQDEHLTTIYQKPAALTGSAWILAITTVTWEHTAQVWESRNHARHGTDATSSLAARTQQALRETSALYDRRDEILSKDADIFHETLALHTVVEKTTYQLQSWLNTWRPVILRSIPDAQNLNLRFVRTLDYYFRRNPSQNPDEHNDDPPSDYSFSDEASDYTPGG
jgi:hypothetical protein